MDQFEKMRKMNDLAKDLKQHGFAESSFEAIQQASQIYGEDELTHEVKHGLINSPHEKIAGEEKMSEIDIERKFKKMQDSVDALTSKMNEMIQAINDMDSRITQLSKRPVVQERPIERPQEKTAPAQPTTHQPAEQGRGSQADSGEYANQRVGNFQSQDVAIDKMFYYGKK